MIGEEEPQEQAALYALGLLDAAEAATFEARLSADAELRALTRELTDAAAAVALEAPQHAPPPAVKARVRRQIAEEKLGVVRPEFGTTAAAAADRPAARFAWIPWAIAAGLVGFCGVLVHEQAQLRREVTALQNVNPLGDLSVYELAAAPNAPQKAHASVAWDAKRQGGVLRVSNLPTPAAGKDYQLWVISPESKEPVSAGVFHVNAQGVAQTVFKPSAAARAQVFAISLEQAGGSLHNQGPIMLVSGS